MGRVEDSKGTPEDRKNVLLPCRTLGLHIDTLGTITVRPDQL